MELKEARQTAISHIQTKKKKNFLHVSAPEINKVLFKIDCFQGTSATQAIRLWVICGLIGAFARDFRN